MSEWRGVATWDGKEMVARISFSPATKAKFKERVKERSAIRILVTEDEVESQKARAYYEGCVVPLICFYQEGLDHKNTAHRKQVREWLKMEFNSEIVIVHGKQHRIAQSSKGRAVFEPFVRRVQDWFEENYNPPPEAMDPEKYKYWDQAIRSFAEGPDDYIGYLQSINILPAK